MEPGILRDAGPERLPIILDAHWADVLDGVGLTKLLNQKSFVLYRFTPE